MNRGCAPDPEIRRLVAEFCGAPEQTSRLVAITKGSVRAETTEELAIRDGTRAALRSFRPIWICGELVRTRPAECRRQSPVPGDGVGSSFTDSLGIINACYRGVSNDGFIKRSIDRYINYVVARAGTTINAVIDVVGEHIKESRLLGAILAVVYLLVGYLAYEAVKTWLTGKGFRRK
jgi:hypothetical protein